MRKYTQLSAIRVMVHKHEVAEFAKRWPCFGPVRPLSFTFDKRNGDLIDIKGERGMDQNGVNALLSEAKRYAKVGL